MKPRVYVASPFFNGAQIAIVEEIQQVLEKNEFPYYSPRIHSGSLDFTPEQRKDPKAWEPVFKSNVDELHRCDLMIAVVEYAMPCSATNPLFPEYKAREFLTVGVEGNIMLGTGKVKKSYQIKEPRLELEVPDSGVVWEMGYWKANSDSKAGRGYLKRPIVAYHSSETKQLNLMISHSVDGILLGKAALHDFFRSTESDSFKGVEYHFNWSVVKRFGGTVE